MSDGECSLDRFCSISQSICPMMAQTKFYFLMEFKDMNYHIDRVSVHHQQAHSQSSHLHLLSVLSHSPILVTNFIWEKEAFNLGCQTQLAHQPLASERLELFLFKLTELNRNETDSQQDKKQVMHHDIWPPIEPRFKS